MGDNQSVSPTSYRRAGTRRAELQPPGGLGQSPPPLRVLPYLRSAVLSKNPGGK